jgi:hypothetical protein
MALTLTIDERTELQRRVRSLKIRAEDARRARVILICGTLPADHLGRIVSELHTRRADVRLRE